MSKLTDTRLFLNKIERQSGLTHTPDLYCRVTYVNRDGKIRLIQDISELCLKTLPVEGELEEITKLLFINN